MGCTAGPASYFSTGTTAVRTLLRVLEPGVQPYVDTLVKGVPCSSGAPKPALLSALPGVNCLELVALVDRIEAAVDLVHADVEVRDGALLRLETIGYALVAGAEDRHEARGRLVL